MTISATGRVVGRWHGAWLRVEGHWIWYRRHWLSTLYSTGLQPVLFLAAMGLGFGSQVRAGAATGGFTYLVYVAPALLVAGAAQQAVGDSTYPVLSGFKWQKDYVAVAATPVSPGQLVGAHFIWTTLKLTLAGSIYALIALFFGAWQNFGALAVILVGTFTGLACAAPMTAMSAKTFDEGQRFGLIFRFVVMPATLFSGTFFPITQIPLYLRWLAWLSPLWHGTQLSRAATLGGVTPWAAAGHAAYLLALVAVGWALAHRWFYRRLVA
ncbi:MAG TPA: ABC transporter permease [Amycolatopsis sp.]|jgi:lipooligosaccharide transport system permease protein|nr:ABC transporter permease [Amycolatopsis sp.]